MPSRASRRLTRATLLLGLASLCLAAPASAQPAGSSPALPLARIDNGPNSPAAQSRHYLVLVLLGGLRWDDAARVGATRLLAIGKAGVWAPDGMMPVYPAQSAPDRYSLVTGLYPGSHGIVADRFLDPGRNARYSSDEPAAADDSWYGGVPLWSLAESQGMRTACLLWIACDARIAGFRPSYYAAAVPSSQADPPADRARVDAALALLRLPAAQRPHFIAIAFSHPGVESRRFGPDAPQTRAAALRMDALVGTFRAALDSTRLPIDLVVVSDQGMVKVDGAWIGLDQFADLSGFDSAGNLLYAGSEADRARLYDQLKHASSQFMAFRLRNLPADLNSAANPRQGDPVIVATGPFAIRVHLPTAGSGSPAAPAGICGFDPHIVPDMKAGFFAVGPDLRGGRTVAPFDNVNLYPWMAHLLGLNPPKNDGSLNILAGTLLDDGVARQDQESPPQP